MSIKDTVSVITGRVRNEQRAIGVVRALANMRDRGLIDRVIIATWHGELEPYLALGHEIDALAIEVILMPAPEASMQESHQKLPLLAALNFVDERSFVTRHRFDRVFPDRNFADYMARIRRDGPVAVSIPHAPFRYHVTVNSAMVDVPFFFGDFIFSGLRDDIAAIVEINAHAELFRSPELNPEMTFFATPFLRQFPEIADYFATYPGMSYGRPDFEQALRAARLGTNFYLDLFALHVHLATSHFTLGYCLDDATLSDAKIDLDAILFSAAESNPVPGTFYFPLAGHLAAKNGYVFEQIAAGNVVASAVAEYIVARIDNLRTQIQMPAPFRMRVLGPDAHAYADNLVAHGLPDTPRYGAVSRNGRILGYNIAQFATMTWPLARVNGSNDMGEWGVL